MPSLTSTGTATRLAPPGLTCDNDNNDYDDNNDKNDNDDNDNDAHRLSHRLLLGLALLLVAVVLEPDLHLAANFHEK